MAALSLKSAVKLRSGYEIPQLGYGVYQVLADVTEACVTNALDAGYRHIDCAVAYRNQESCGRAIHAAGSKDRQAGPPIPRSDIFYTSKVRPKEMSYKSACAQVDETLRDMGLEYIDLMLLHAPYGGPENRKGAWRALVEAVEAGKVRSIGVSNYGVHHLDELERHIAELEQERGGPGKGGIISVGQWEVHPWCPRRDIVAWCEKRGIVVEAYCPLVRNKRADEKVLEQLTAKHGKKMAQVLVRWSLQKGFVPLPKSENPGRIKENAELYDFELSEEDMKALEIEGEDQPVAWNPTTAGLEA